MNSSIVRSVTLGLGFLFSSHLVFAQTQTATKAVKPLGSLSGRVTIKDKAAPGVAVALRKTDYFNPYDAGPRGVTDQDGNYKINNIAAGAYQITFGAPGYVLADNTNRSIVV